MSIKYGTPTDEQLAKINELSKRTLSADEVFSFSGKSAGNMMIPNRYMDLSPEILKVMADDAKKGVSFMLNHNWSRSSSGQAIPYGKVFDGRVVDSQDEGETVALFLDKYIVRDDETVDGMSANALIKKIETGILSDTSIGWGTDVMICSICKKNYYSRECKHWKGNKYEMGDGTQKTCTVTAMPPTVMIPTNNNALFEESIVWDGAYPGAMVTQSKEGDIIELPTGKFTIVPDKEEYPEGTLYRGYYHNGDMVAMVKKSEPKKVYPSVSLEKGSESLMNEDILKLLEALEIKVEEGKILSTEEMKELIAEKFKVENSPEEPKEEYLSKEQAEKTLGEGFKAEDVLKLAKEGADYHKQVIDETIAMGVKAMGNDFPADTWKDTFSTMGTKAIKDIGKTFEKQAKEDIPAGKLSTDNENEGNIAEFPDEAFYVGR